MKDNDFRLDIRVTVKPLWLAPTDDYQEKLWRDELEQQLNFCASRFAGEFRDIAEGLIRAARGRS